MDCIATVFEGPEQTEASDMIGRGSAINTDSAAGPQSVGIKIGQNNNF